MKTGGEVVRRDLRAKPRCLQSRIEQTESAERCQAVRTEVFLFCYRPTPPEINTHLSSTGKQAAADVFNMELTNPCVCLCVRCVFVHVCVLQNTSKVPYSAAYLSELFMTKIGHRTDGDLEFLIYCSSMATFTGLFFFLSVIHCILLLG